MKINFKTMRKREIKVGDKVTLIPGFEKEEYIIKANIKEGQVFDVIETRKEPNELCFKGGMYWQMKQHFKIVE